MNSSNFRISLDVHEVNSQVTLHVKKGDTARKILVTLTEKGRPYRITDDCSAVFTARKSDDSILYNACAIQGNMIEYSMTAQTTAAAGVMRCELRLYGADSALITSPRFLIIVDDTVYSDGDVIESSNEFSELTQLIDQTKEVKQDFEKLAAMGVRLPIAIGESGNGATYSAYGEDLPEVQSGSCGTRVGKGRQIIFIPDTENEVEDPTLSINDGEEIVIRLRAEKNQGQNVLAPEATMPVPVGALMRGVPYTLTFCGKYWLVDSMIGGTGGAAWVTFEIDDKGDLYVVTADSFRGAEFSLTEDGTLEVVTYE